MKTPPQFVRVKTEYLYLLAAVIFIAVAFFVGRGCGEEATVIEKPDTTIDTSEADKKVEAEKAEAKETSEKKIEALEKEHSDTIEHFEEEQREEYEAVRQQGPDAVADWLTDFNKKLGGK